MKFLLKFLFTILILSISAPLVAQTIDIKNIGNCYVQNYTKEIYKSGNQNWSVVKDSRGVMYFGNSKGLLTFDGRHWKLYPMPDNTIVRAVATDNKGKVYVGGFGEFGYWAYSPDGILNYTSLVKLVPDKLMSKDEIWKIYVEDKRVIFQSFACIYIYEEGKISTVKSPEYPFLFLLKARDRYFVEVFTKGLFELIDNRLQFIEGSEKLGNTKVHSVLPLKNNGFIIGTAELGLYIYDGKQIVPWENQANDFLKTNQLNNGTVVADKYYAFGTILNGIIILNEAGNVVQQISKTFGLQNNTVLSLYVDDMQDLWAGLDNGIDRVELNSPLYYYFDKTGILGTIYSSVVYNNKIYVATNHGLFSSNYYLNSDNRLQSFDFTLIKGSEGQVWNLSLIDNQLICGQNEKTFRVSGNELVKISDVAGGWTIKKLNSNPEFLIQGSYTGLVIYKKDNSGNWIFSHKVAGFNEPVRYIEQDNKGQLWIGHPYKGLYKLVLSQDLTRIQSQKYYNEKNGLPANVRVNTLNFDNQIVFSSEQGIYNYNELGDNFEKFNQLNNRLGSFYSANSIIKADERKYWFISHGRIALVDVSQAGRLTIDSSTFNVLAGKMIDFYENINKINNFLYLISIDEGFALFDTKTTTKEAATLPAILIGDVRNITDSTFTIAEAGTNASAIAQMFYDKNNISISYSLPYYKQANIQYQYFLEGYSKQWSEWNFHTQKEFTNLKQGKYRFLVRAKINESIVTAASSYEFIILPPWYATVWAYITYLVLFICLIILLRHIYLKRLLKQHQKIQHKLEMEKQEALKKEMQANEQRIAKLKTQQLEADLAAKNRELANSTMSIVTKNELLQKISDELVQLKDKEGKKLPSEQLRKIQNVINEGMNDERDWNIFEKSFNEAHENFFKKLKAKCPDLSPSDFKLCAYLRMNMSSKDLVSILNITLRGVEIRRYRLRKKLNLEHDKNLVEFLMEL